MTPKLQPAREPAHAIGPSRISQVNPPLSGAPALKVAIRSAREARGIRSDAELAKRSGVHLQTLQNWMYGKTTPRGHELRKVAMALDVSYDGLMALYEGRQPSVPLEEAVLELAAAIRELSEALK